MSVQRFDFETPECAAAMNDSGAFVERGPDYIIVYDGDDIPQTSQPVPDAVSPRQIRLALNQLGLRAMVEQAVASGSQDLRDWWEYALDIERDNALVVGMAQQLGITEQQINDLFRLAATL